jgi:enterochelin esterase-like enzyme
MIKKIFHIIVAFSFAIFSAVLKIASRLFRLFTSSKVDVEETQIDTSIKISRYEKLYIHSKVLDKEMRINVYLPNGYGNGERYHVLYIFHGLDAIEDSWIPYMGLERTADDLTGDKKIKPLIIVSPEIDNSFGINSYPFYMHVKIDNQELDMGMYEDYICEELVPFIDKEFSTISDRSGRYIGGFSMGGFIALHTSFLHTDMFSRVGGHSPALWSDNNLIDYAMKLLYPTRQLREERDPIFIAQTKQDLNKLSIYLDCGDEDEYMLYKGSAELYNILKTKGVNVSYFKNVGKHDFIYWMSHIKEYLLFYAGV